MCSSDLTFIDRQKRMAREEAQRQQRDLGLDAAQAGVLSGGFEAIARSEQERNLANQLQDIQAAGDMANFQQARQAYESDRRNRMDLADLGLRGFEGTGKDVIDWVNKVKECGAGEILLTSMDRDGTKEGFDNKLTKAVSSSVPIPVIVIRIFSRHDFCSRILFV